MANYQELVARWDGYLQKLKDRFFEILKQADGPLDEVINGLQYDDIVIINIKTGLNNQTVNALAAKANEGWSFMMAEANKSGGLSWNQQQEQKAKIDVFKEWLAVEFLKFETGLYARAARKILENVKTHIDDKKMHRCTQCGAELPIKVFSFMAINLKCDSCGSVNTYQPDDRVKALEYYVIIPLAEEAALPEKIQARTNKYAMRDYYKKYYGYLMENVPDKKDFYARDLNERLTNPMFLN
jgi:hypothetical protein